MGCLELSAEKGIGASLWKLMNDNYLNVNHAGQDLPLSRWSFGRGISPAAFASGEEDSFPSAYGLGIFERMGKRQPSPGKCIA
ncbi:MAG TPA: hypothetical protein DET40_25080 [Lentisphaeria bacterium]|nr:MAG: hypothetical protein A2X45_18880 [Lentisphaerae bacterium GWF2_50_93]HCE46834.1 hypothetical protein [Lentisphaeria bacterium]